MALDSKIIDIALQLYKNNFFENINSVIDMGDQDLNISFTELKKKILYYKINIDETFDRASVYPERPRLSSSVFWSKIGIKQTDRLDLEKLDRNSFDPINKFFKVNLNFPIDDQEKYQKYDLVTDFGNNEHPFNIVESYKTMHKLCKKNGYLFIHQAMFRGNGYYNFDPCFFENMAAVNKYECLHSSFVFQYPEGYFTTQLNSSILKLINLNGIKYIGIIYLFKKSNEDDFKLPYQGSGETFNKNEYYSLKLNLESDHPSRYYLASDPKELSSNQLIKILINKIKKKFKN